MRTHFSLVTLAAVGGLLWVTAAPSPSAAPPAAPAAAPGGWTTGSTGALGPVVYPSGEHVIDLATEGVFDPLNWRVVFDFETLDVQDGAILTFENHPTRAPVVFRATGDVTIAGTIDLRGAKGHNTQVSPSFAEPGPGGFRGGRGSWGQTGATSAGFGPGGGHLPPDSFRYGGTASHQTQGPNPGQIPTAPTYGSNVGSHLVGGSGGAAGGRPYTQYPNTGGGAGGGAILIGSDTRVSITGDVQAWGGTPGNTQGENGQQVWGIGGTGSGGVIRVAAPEIDVVAGANLNATGSAQGYLRLEVDGDMQADGDPNPDIDGGILAPQPSIAIQLGEFLPQDPARVELAYSWDPDAGGGSGAWVSTWSHPQGPRAVFYPVTQADVQVPAPGSVTFKLESTHVPSGSAMTVRVARVRGQTELFANHPLGPMAGMPIQAGQSTGPMGEASTEALGWTDVTLDLSEGVTAMQARAILP